MLDIKFIRENPKAIKENQKKRGLDSKDIDILLNFDKKWRSLKNNIDSLRHQRNKISQEINKVKKQGKSISELVKKAKKLPQEIDKKNSEIKKIEKQRFEILKNIPNIIDKSVPIGDVTKNKVLKTKL